MSHTYSVKKPQGRSYIQDSKDGHRHPPSWVDLRQKDRVSIQTDDAQFTRCWFIHNTTKSGKVVSYAIAWKRGSTWFEATVDARRVRSLTYLEA